MSETGEVPREVVEAFTAAATIALQELAQVEALPDYAQHDPRSRLVGPVVLATIRLLRTPPGVMSLLLGADTAAKLAARYLPPGTIVTDEMVDDVAGEFANVIAGQAKTMLKGSPYHFTLSLPEVLRASDSSRLAAMTTPRLQITLNCECGQIAVLAD